MLGWLLTCNHWTAALSSHHHNRVINVPPDVAVYVVRTWNPNEPKLNSRNVQISAMMYLHLNYLKVNLLPNNDVIARQSPHKKRQKPTTPSQSRRVEPSLSKKTRLSRLDDIDPFLFICCLHLLFCFIDCLTRPISHRNGM